MRPKRKLSCAERHSVAQSCGRVLPSPPLFALQPLLGHVVASISKRHPELFARLGFSCRKSFLIDPSNLPFVLLLKPSQIAPQLVAYGRGQDIGHDVHISGSFLTLLKLINGEADSDALFFNRNLKATGDTEAIVALRNALDDMDGTLASDVAASFGPLSRPVRALFDMANRAARTRP